MNDLESRLKRLFAAAMDFRERLAKLPLETLNVLFIVVLIGIWMVFNALNLKLVAQILAFIWILYMMGPIQESAKAKKEEEENGEARSSDL